MATSDLARLARTLPRDQFIARHPGLFLVLQQDNDSAPDIGFRTHVGASRDAAPSPAAADDPSGLEMLPLQKAPGHPYPDRISVGRARNCDLVLRHPSVSKLHAHFRVSGSDFHLVDLDSNNGTKVNARLVPPQGALPVAAGDTLYFGHVRVELMDAARLFDLVRRLDAY